MLTTNYYSLLTALAIAPTTNGAIKECKIKSWEGGVYSSPKYGTYQQDRQYFNASLLPCYIGNDGASSGESWLRFGTGIAPETIQDYTITMIPAMTFSIGGLTVNYDESTKTFTATKRYVLNNTRTSAVTITEYGVFGCCNATNGATQVLLYRELLEEPFTIEPNETVNFDLTLTYDLPDNFIPYA